MNNVILIVMAVLLLAAFAKVVKDIYDPSLSDSDRAARRERNEAGIL